MAYLNSDNVLVYEVEEKSALVTLGKITSSVPTSVAGYSNSCLLLGNDGKRYGNQGTSTSCDFQDMDSISTAEIANGAVTLAKLASVVAPSHIVKFAGNVTWSGSGATKALTATGVASTDIVTATIKTAPTQDAYLVSAAPTTDTITFTLSAANTSNDAVIAYQVLRATS